MDIRHSFDQIPMMPTSMLHDGPSFASNLQVNSKADEHDAHKGLQNAASSKPLLPTKKVNPMLDYSVQPSMSNNHPLMPSKFVKKNPLAAHHQRLTSETQVLASVKSMARNFMNLSTNIPGVMDDLQYGVQGSHRMFAGSL